MPRLCTIDAFAVFDAACLAEDIGPGSDADLERRWHAGRDAYRANVETAADALVLISRLVDANDLPAVIGMAISGIIERGPVSADLPVLRKLVAGVGAAATSDGVAGVWIDQVVDGMASLSAFLFRPRLASVTS